MKNLFFLLSLFSILISSSLFSQNSSISGTVFRDENNDGNLDNIDLTQSAVTVNLFNDANANGQLDNSENKISEFITEHTGTFSFDSLANGNYILKVDSSDFPSNVNFTTSDLFAVTINNGNEERNFGYTGDAIGCFAFAANGDRLYVFNRHSSTNKAIGPQSNAANIQAMALTPDGKTLWAVNNIVNNNRLGRVNQNTGQFTALSSSFGVADGTKGQIQLDSVFGISFDFSTGDLYGLSSVSGNNVLFKIDTTSGSHVSNAFGQGNDYLEIQQVNGDKENDDIAFNPIDGKLYALEQDAGSGANGTFVTIDITNGNVTVVGSTNIDNLEGLTFSRNGNFIGTSGQQGNQPKSYFDIDENNGNITLIAAFNGSGNDFESCACNSPEVNLPPQAMNDAVSTPQSTPVTIDVQSNDNEPDSEMLITSIIDSTENGSLTLLNNDSIEYTPNALFTGRDTLTYKVCDPNGNCDQAIATINVTFINQGPVAINDADTTSENQSITTDVQRNDSDPNGDSLTTTIVNSPANGTVSVNPNNTVIYTPDSNFTGNDSYTYQVCDQFGACDQAQVTILVLSVDNEVIARDDNATTSVDSSVVIDVQENDNCNRSLLSADCVKSDSNYVVTYNGYTDSNGNSTISFTIRNNGSEDLSNAAFSLPQTGTASSFSSNNYSFMVENPTNNPFYAIKFNASNTAGYKNGSKATFTYTVDSVLFRTLDSIDVSIKAGTDSSLFSFNRIGCSSENDCNLTTTIAEQPDSGSAMVINGDSIIYTPDTSFSGRDTITYSACDMMGVCDTATVIINVQNSNSGPLAMNDSDTTRENTPVIIGVQQNDTDPDGDNLTTSMVSTPSNGSVTIINGDSIRYTPDNGFIGTDNFNYTVCDPNGLCDQANVIVTVLNANNAPDANDDFTTTSENTSTLIPVQDNDTDPENDTLTTTIVTPPSNGTATVVNDSILYDPNTNFNGRDTLTYSVCDPMGLCDTAQVIISVTNINQGPTAINDQDTTQENTTTVIDVQANDIDPDGDPLTTTISSAPSNGTVTVLNGDSIEYVPAMNFSGTDQFNYQICDGSNACDIATVTVVVVPNNNAPNANDDFVFIPENTSDTIPVLDNDSDPDNDPLTVTIDSPPSNGTATILNDSIVYTPNINFNGRDTLTYSACDAGGLCDTATVIIRINNVNQGPVAKNDRDTTREVTPVIVDVQANDTDADGDDLTTTIINNPSNGVVNVLGSDSVSYLPNPGFTGFDTFTYQVCDPSNLCDIATVTIFVVPANNAPDANDDFVQIPENTSDTIAVQSNDSDPENDPLITGIVMGPDSGTAIVLNDSIVYTPNMNFNGKDTIIYSVCDPVLCDTAIVVITVNDVNNDPIARNDRDTTLESTPVVVDVQNNDTDPNGDILTSTIVNNPSNGSVTIINNDSIQYSPNAGFTGTDQFTYQVCDPSSACDQATVTILVVPNNNAPVANDDFESTQENRPIVSDVQNNDFDPDGDVIFTSIVSGPNNGSATVSNADSITYAPAVNFSGRDTIVYRICDAAPLCDTALLIISVTDFNSSPVAIDDRDTTLENTAVITDVQLNDFDQDGDSLVTSILNQPSNGTVSVINADSIQYTPPTNFNGTISYTYQVCDTSGACDQANVTIVVLPANNAPVAVNDFRITEEDRSILIDVQTNDFDPDGDPLITTVISQPSNGSAVVSVFLDSVLYTPDMGFNGRDTLQYQVCDNGGLCDTALVIIRVTGINEGPTARDDRDVTRSGVPVITDVQLNDTDPDGDSLTTSAVSQATNGTVNIINGDSVQYIPNIGFSGTDTYSYSVCDPSGFCDQAVVTILVLKSQNPPVAQNDFEVTPMNTSVISDVQANDTDIDGDTLITTISTNASNGNAVVLGDDSIMYTPNTGFTGRDTIVYKVCDPILCDSALLIVRVFGVNASPIAINDFDTTSENTTVIIDVQSNDINPDGDVLTTTLQGQVLNGTVSLLNGDSASYTPNPGFTGLDYFFYQICDPSGRCDVALVTVLVTPVNSPPVANRDFEITPKNTAVTSNVQANDFDPDGDPLTTTIDASNAFPRNGSATVNNNDSITYTPTNGFVGRDTVYYSVCDPGGLCDTSILIIRIFDVNTSPTAVNDFRRTDENTPVVVDVQENDIDPDGDVLITTLNSNPANGTVSVQNGDSVLYTPDAGFTGNDFFTYRICDPSGACDIAQVRILVQSNNADPIALNDTSSTLINTPVIVDVQANDSDPDGDKLSTVSVINAASNGSTTINNANTITYIPTSNYTGTDEFIYQVCDGNGNCANALVYITVINNLPPVANNDSVSTLMNTDVTINSLQNDLDPDGDALTIRSINSPMNGSVLMSNDNFIYTPRDGYSGNDEFNYEICDGISGCDTALVYISIQQLTGVPFIPNGITPNDDGKNDALIIGNVNPSDQLELTIINRWGMEVYKKGNYDQSWKGQNNEGEELPDGTYFIILKVNNDKSYTNYLDLRR